MNRCGLCCRLYSLNTPTLSDTETQGLGAFVPAQVSLEGERGLQLPNAWQGCGPCYSGKFKRTEFSTQGPHGSSQPSATPVPRGSNALFQPPDGAHIYMQAKAIMHIKENK